MSALDPRADKQDCAPLSMHRLIQLWDYEGNLSKEGLAGRGEPGNAQVSGGADYGVSGSSVQSHGWRSRKPYWRWRATRCLSTCLSLIRGFAQEYPAPNQNKLHAYIASDARRDSSDSHTSQGPRALVDISNVSIHAKPSQSKEGCAGARGMGVLNRTSESFEDNAATATSAQYDSGPNIYPQNPGFHIKAQHQEQHSYPQGGNHQAEAERPTHPPPDSRTPAKQSMSALLSQVSQLQGDLESHMKVRSSSYTADLQAKRSQTVRAEILCVEVELRAGRDAPSNH
eukprot:scaffold80170_cov43-Prasinocladus_malaysianus.AAC.4